MKTHNPVHMVCARPCSLLLLGLAGWLAGISQSAAQSPPTLQIYGPYGVSENAGTLTVGIGLTPPSTQPVSVSFATIDGTAHAGTDYGARNGTITFQPGENFKNISVPIFDNGQVDGSRYFSIQFSNVEGALLPSYSSSLFLSISDNELPNIVATSFNPGSGVYGYDETIGTVKKLVLQPDGKVLIGGDFNTVAGNLRKGFARLNSNGSYDTNFNFGAGTDGKVQALALQPNGQILVGGQFATVNGLGHANLARINPDGTVENSFTASTDDSGVVYSLVVQPDGRVLVGGNFQKVNGSSRYCLARLLPSGALDSAFQVSAITNMYVRGLALLPDGRIAVACNATNAYLNTYIAQRVLLLNSDGSVDPSFVAAGPYAYDDLSGIALQPTTSKLLVYGAFGYFSGQYRNSGLVRLNMDGSVDALFNPYVGFLPVQDLAFRPDGSMIVVGNDKSSFPVPSYYSPLVLTSLNAAGGFEPNITSVQADNPINAVAIQPDGRILVGGSFTAINSVSRVGIARLDFQGTTGNAFNFTKATFTGHEEDAGTTIQIQRLGSSTAAASVTFSTSDGTAQSTLDYIGQTNVITFAPLEVQKSIFIPLLDDSLVERDETVQLKLTNPSASAEVGAQGIATLVIQQEERPVLVDTSFNPGTGANRKVYAIARQPDGKLIIGGQFVTINGMPRNYIARLNTNGTVDQSFNVGTGPNSYVRALALQPDGKVILGGQFWSVNGISHYGVARLNTDGSLDTNFNATIYGGGEVVNSLALQPNGQVLVAGTFYAVNGYNSYYLTRLNSDGSLDQAFSISNASKPSITLASVALQSDGKILAGGYYSAALLRFQSDGSWDTNFAPAGLSFTNNYFNYGRIKALKVLSNDHILVGGLFREPHRNIARLNPDGSLDSNFNPGTGANNSVNVIALDAGGKLVIGGEFFSYNDTASRRLARLNGDGSLDFTFNPGTGVNDEIQDILIQPDNKYVLGGEFSAVNGINLDHIARVYGYPVSFQSISWSDIDLSVHESSGAQSLTLRRYGSSSNTISASYSTADVTAHSGVDYIAQSGTITLGPLETTKSISIAVIDDGLPEEENEFFQVVASPVTPGLEQGLNTVATVTIKDSQTPLYQDHSLNVNYSPYGNLNTVLVQSDGKFLAGGLFYYPNGPTNMARFNSDGSLDKSFLATGTDGEVRVITFDLDGNLLVGGSFVQMNGSSARFLARLSPNGALDSTFAPGSTLDGQVRAILVQPDHKIVVAGNFVSFSPRVMRLNTDGSLDPSFNVGSGANDRVRVLLRQPDGRIIIAGRFLSYNLIPRNYVARINDDGSLDTTFDPGAVPNNEIRAAVLQPDGKIIIGGEFTTNAQLPRSYVARLNTNGTLDTTFIPGVISNGYSTALVGSLLLQSDGKLIVGGEFSTVDGFDRPDVVRLNSDGSLDHTFYGGKNFSPYYNYGVVNAVALQANGELIMAGSSLYSPDAYNNGYYSSFLRVFLDSVNQSGIELDQVYSSPFFFAESQTDLVYHLKRVGNTRGVSTVNFATVPGTATPGTDYLPANGTVSFGPLEITKEIVLSILDDDLAEQDETLNLIFSNPSANTVLSGSANVPLQILDNERPGARDTAFPVRFGGFSTIYELVVQPDTNILVGGYFNYLNNQLVTNLARLHPDGSLDTTFQPNVPWPIFYSVTTMQLQSDGKILIGNNYTFARLNSDGTLDTTFAARGQFAKPFIALPDGKILCFEQETNVVRLNNDGTLDPTFNSFAASSAYTQYLLREPGGTILVGYGNVLKRYTADGFFLAEFDLPYSFYSLALEPDGKILAGMYQASGVTRLLRLLANGTIDPAFTPALNSSALVQKMLPQADGKIVIFGSFTSVNGTNRSGFARLFPDGSLDLAFEPGNTMAFLNSILTGTSYVTNSYDFTAAALLPNGKILASFRDSFGTSAGSLIRINGDLPLRLHPPTRVSASQFSLNVDTIPGSRYVLQNATNLPTWSPLATNTASSYYLNYTVTNYPASRRFYRVQQVPQP